MVADGMCLPIELIGFDNVLFQALSLYWAAGVTGSSGSEVGLCGWIQSEGRFFHSLLLCSRI